MTATFTRDGCPVDDAFDPLSPDHLADPYAVLAALPAGGAPVFYAPSIGYYVVTRYADVEQVFRDPQTYSAAVAQARTWKPAASNAGCQSRIALRIHGFHWSGVSGST